MSKGDRLYTVTLKKDMENDLYISRVSQNNLKHGTVVETPISVQDSIVVHVDAVKEVLESKILAYYNKNK